MSINLKPTCRGFMRGEFDDAYGQKCSIQESSFAELACIWLGVDIDHAGQTVHQRAHLSQERVRELLPILQHFAEHGTLPEGNDDTR